MQNELIPSKKGRETSENFTTRSGVNVNGMIAQMRNDALLGQTTFVRNDKNNSAIWIENDSLLSRTTVVKKNNKKY